MGISGTWYKELDSKMTLVPNKNGLTGEYASEVGDAKYTDTLVGSFDSQGNAEDSGQAVGWVVLWVNETSNSHSVTTWSGQYQIIDGKEEITALWLLTSGEPPSTKIFLSESHQARKRLKKQ